MKRKAMYLDKLDGRIDDTFFDRHAAWRTEQVHILRSIDTHVTAYRLHIPPQLRKTLASTNVIESAFSIVERVCSNVKRLILMSAACQGYSRADSKIACQLRRE
jgi:transposase-like protein